MAGRRRTTEIERFMSHVQKAESGCWLWTAYRMPNGYGKFRMPTHGELAHRASHRLFKGPVDAQQDVMHSCDNPACVNPEHLSVGLTRGQYAGCEAQGKDCAGRRPRPKQDHR